MNVETVRTACPINVIPNQVNAELCTINNNFICQGETVYFTELSTQRIFK